MRGNRARHNVSAWALRGRGTGNKRVRSEERLQGGIPDSSPLSAVTLAQHGQQCSRAVSAHGPLADDRKCGTCARGCVPVRRTRRIRTDVLPYPLHLRNITGASVCIIKLCFVRERFGWRVPCFPLILLSL